MFWLLTFIRKNWLLLTIVMILVITGLSLWPLKEMPKVPGNDKIDHFIAYLFLMLPTALRKPNKWLLLGLSFILYSGVIELIQPYINRHGEWLDMLANASGVVSGIIIARFLNLFPFRKKDFE